MVKDVSKWTAQQIEIAVVRHFDMRRNLCIPNVSWGFFHNHEADLLIVTNNDWCSEVEIKVSAQDIKKDMGKKHGHKEAQLKYLWFAVPEELSGHADIPDHAGILSCSKFWDYKKRRRYFVKRIRLPKADKEARKITEKERADLMRLGCLRIWMLKEKLDGYSYHKEKNKRGKK